MKRLIEKSDLANYIILSLMAFMTGIFAPLEIYMTNIHEFWFKLSDVLKMAVLVFIAMEIGLLLLYTILKLASPKASAVYTYVIFILAVLIYIQGNYVPNTHGMLDGSVIDWNTICSDRIVSWIVWILGIVLAVIAYIKFKDNAGLFKAMTVVAACIVLVQVVTLVTVAINNRDQFSTKNVYYATDAHETEFSSKENVIILVQDSFDSSLFTEVLAEDSDGAVTSELDGFTYYPDTLGRFNYTQLGIPMILNGVAYDNQSVFNDFMIQGFSENPLYTRMLEENWNMGIYTSNYLTPCDFVANLCNTTTMEDVTISSRRRFLTTYYKLVAYKYAPYELKKLFWLDTAVFDTLKDDKSEAYEHYFEDDNQVFLDKIGDITTEESESVFKLIHTDGTHRPSHTDEYGQTVDEEVSDITDAKGNVYILRQLIAKLKEEGVYDNTAIIVMADHGLNCGEDSALCQNPLLLVKGFGESHSLEVSDLALSYDDLRTIYGNVMDGKQSEDIVAGINNADRYFGWYMGNITIWDTHTSPITEYVLPEGCKAGEATKMYATGKIWEWEE